MNCWKESRERGRSPSASHHSRIKPNLCLQNFGTSSTDVLDTALALTIDAIRTLRPQLNHQAVPDALIQRRDVVHLS